MTGALKTALIITVVAATPLLLAGNHASAWAKTASPHADASQLGPTVSVDTTQQQTATSDAGNDADGSVAAEVVAPAGPQTQLPAGNATLSQLLRLWGVFGDKVDSSCARLSVGDLRCLAGQGNLATLARFDRPALLLLDRDGHRQWVLLSALNDKQAALVGADGGRRVERQQLAKLWSGQFEIIWRASDGKTLIRRGMHGQAVVWLQQQLAAAADNDDKGDNNHKDDKDAGAKSSATVVFDADMEARVRNFQLLHGLQPDGLVGPRTQLVLNGLTLDPGVPTLTPESQDDK